MSLPKYVPLNVQDFFGALVPGAIGTAIIMYLFHDSELAQHFKELSTIAQWVAFGIVSLILGYLAYPPSHLFNKAYDLSYRRWKRRKGDDLFKYASRRAPRGSPGSVYDWVRNRVEAKDKAIALEIQRIQGFSKMFRTVCLFLLLAIMVFLFRRDWTPSIIGFGIFIASFLVFCERRFAATSLVYQRFQDLDEHPPGRSSIVLPDHE